MACNPGRHRPLAARPELAVLAMESVDSWANVEAIQLNTFVTILGGSESLAAALFLSLGTQGPKSAAINAAAAQRFPERVCRVLAAILRITKTNGGRRDRLVHWSWGTSPDLPDALLLMDPRVLLTWLNEPSKVRENTFVYFRNDFDSIIKDNVLLCRHYNRLRALVDEADQLKADLIYDELCAEPDIRETLDRQAERAQSQRGEAR